MKKRWIWVVLIGVVALLIIAAFYIGYDKGKVSGSSIAKAYNNASNYPLLAKRIFIENPNDPQINFEPLRQQLKDYDTKNNLVSSIYFEYLPTGTSIRVDGDEQKTAASLIKLPAAMELYKAAELGKIDLDQTVTIQQEWLDDAYGDLYKKGAGYQLTLREAAKIMLQNSDNTALNVVSYHTDGLLNDEQTPVSALDININVGENYTIAIGARDYSSVLKCLYFSCYLNNAHSQELLDYLSNTQFNDRLKAGIADKSIIVAHKIGNFAQDTQSDCGIVYVPNRNYILCAMIKGPDNTQTDAKIAALSKLTYDFVTSQKIN